MNAVAKLTPVAVALILSVSTYVAPDIAVAQAFPGYSVPAYTCLRNWYLSPTGSDANSGNSQSSPWLTLQQADANVHAGDCVNLASGTYSQTAPIILRHGGNANTPTGYVTYRSSTPQGAHIIMATQLPAGASLMYLSGPNYLVFDGLEIDGNNNYVPGDCIGTYPVGVHHIVAENNLIHGCGESGIGLSWGEYYWYVNNTVYNNSNYTEGSGLDIFQPDLATVYDPSFVPNANDQALYYHIVVANNIVHDNIVLRNDGIHSDGNGILFDDFNHHEPYDPLSSIPYTQPSLIVSNIAYNNGAGGITVYASQNATVANNSAYNNYIDQLNTQQYWRSEIICGICNNSTFINNAVYSVVGTGYTAYNHAYANLPDTSVGPANVAWTMNIGFPYNAVPITGTGNLFGQDPKFNNAPAGDFSLQSGSLAIAAAVPEPWLSSQTPNMGEWQSSSLTVNLAAPASVSGSPGGSFSYSTNWAGGPTAVAYEIFVHFTDANTNIIFGDDHYPTRSTTQWTGGQYADAARTVTIPATLAVGTYNIMVGLYVGSFRDTLNPGPGVVPDNQLRYRVGTLTVQ